MTETIRSNSFYAIAVEFFQVNILQLGGDQYATLRLVAASLPLTQKVMLPLSLSQSMEAKRIASENDGVFTFLVQRLDQKRVTCCNEKLCGRTI